MAEILGKIWEVLKDADEKFGFRKILLYTTYVLIVLAILNWKSILKEVATQMDKIKTEQHDKDLIVRDLISRDIHPYLVELRALTGADRVMLFEFHNSINNLIGVPFKYITMTDHAEPYGSNFVPKYSDMNSEIIGTFIRDLKVTMFEATNDLEAFKMQDPSVVDALNNSQAKAACYQYMSVLGKPLGILVLEWHSPDTQFTAIHWNKIRSQCSQAAQDLNNIILKHKKNNE